MARYKNKTADLEVEAFRIGYDDSIPCWLMEKITDNTVILHCDNSDTRGPFEPCINQNADINTPNGILHVNCGDYIIQGTLNEIYPLSPDLFEQTYESTEVENE